MFSIQTILGGYVTRVGQVAATSTRTGSGCGVVVVVVARLPWSTNRGKQVHELSKTSTIPPPLATSNATPQDVREGTETAVSQDGLLLAGPLDPGEETHTHTRREWA